MASRQLLRSFLFSRPPAHPPASSHLGNDLRHHLLHRSPVPPPPKGVLGNIRWLRIGSQHSSYSKAPSPGRRVLANMLSASIVSTSAGLLSDHISNQNKPPKKGPQDHQVEPKVCTSTIIGVNVLVHGVDVARKEKLSKWGAKVNHLVAKGQVWRLATSSLLHVDWAHLTCNINSLNKFGNMLEGYVGPGRLLTVYCTSSLSGSLFSYWFTAAPSVGASDAICGLIGAQAVYSWRHRQTLKEAKETLADIAFLVFSNLVIAVFTKHRTDHWAHLGGFLGGAAVELFLGGDEKQHVAKGGVVVLQDKPPVWFS